MFGATGCSVTFPSVNITKDTLYDFIKVRHILIVTYHGSGNIRPPYTGRVNFSSRTGEIELRNLTEDDSGTYEQVVNMKIVAVIQLLVIEPVITPTLRKVNETIHGDQCHVLLECRVQGSGPLNVTILKDGEEITENITTIDRSRFFSVDIGDPGSSGIYTCYLSNPISAKPSSDITIMPPDKICEKSTWDLQNWAIICIIVFIIIIFFIAICIGVQSYQRCQNNSGRYSGHNSRESGNVRPEDASESELQELNTTPPGDGGRRASSCNVSMTDEGEPGESGDVRSKDTSQFEHQILDKTSFPEGKTESSCKVSLTDEEEPADNMILDSDLELPIEDSLNRLDPGPCGQDEASSINPGLCRVSSDHGQGAVS